MIRSAVAAAALMLVASLAAQAIPASAQDALICRKRDEMGGRKGETLHLGSGDDYYNGGPGPDRIYGGPGDDIINGGRGDDVVHGGPGNDIVCGGVGRDKVDGDAGRDEAYGEEGDDWVKGGPGNDYIAGQAGKDRLIGYDVRRGHPIADGRDYLEGSYLPDVLLVGGRDTAFGGFDDDLLRSMTPRIGAKLMDGGLKADRIIGSDAADRIRSGGGKKNRIQARGGDDVVTGGEQMETIYGGGGDDLLRGISGGDQIFGMAGRDLCSGNERAQFDRTCERTRVIDSHHPEFPPSRTAAPFEGPPPIATAAGSCDPDVYRYSWTAGPFPPSEEVLVRYSSSSKGSGLYGYDPDFLWDTVGRETAWLAMPPPPGGSSVSGSIYCHLPGDWSLQFYEPPTTPVTFPGSTMPTDDPMEVLFRVPAADSYVADVTLRGGTLRIRHLPAAGKRFERSGTYRLGLLQPAEIQRLSIDALGKDQARWTIKIHPG